MSVCGFNGRRCCHSNLMPPCFLDDRFKWNNDNDVLWVWLVTIHRNCPAYIMIATMTISGPDYLLLPGITRSTQLASGYLMRLVESKPGLSHRGLHATCFTFNLQLTLAIIIAKEADGLKIFVPIEPLQVAQVRNEREINLKSTRAALDLPKLDSSWAKWFEQIQEKEVASTDCASSATTGRPSSSQP